MTKREFHQWISDGIRVLDGATGTELQKKGMPAGVCPEKWVLDNPATIVEIQQEYIRSGSDIVYSCTFGGNGLKLKEFGIYDAVGFNRELAKLSKQAAKGKALVAGDMAPTGQLMAPFGMVSFEEVVDAYKSQVKGLLEGGVDLFIIETMMDIQEARAALLAVKESCDLPVMVSMTYERGGHTINGTDPVTALITLQSMGADAVGCNCSTGPKEMLSIIKEIKPYAKVPLIAKPNAGMPRLVNGETRFDMDATEFSGYVEAFVRAGVNLIGGCCGTSPQYIQAVAQKAKGLEAVYTQKKEGVLYLTSSRRTVSISRELPICVIGERINPTGKKKLQQELREGSMDLVCEYAMDQIDEGALVLDVNAGVADINETETLTEMVEILSSMVQVPLCLDSSSPEALESALRVYPGRALINSISAEQVKLQKILPVAAKYGAAFILLPLDDHGVPLHADERIEIIKRVYKEAEKYGFGKDDILIDGLVMTIASNQDALTETLKVLRWCYHSFYANTVLGLSNISFGMPERTWLNSSFLAMAAANGLSAAIMNPGVDTLMHVKRASDALTGKDHNSIQYIKEYGSNKEQKENKKQGDPVFNAILDGDREKVCITIQERLDMGVSAAELVDQHMVPAISKVGELYEKKTYFLPQLIQSAETMKAAMEFIQPFIHLSGVQGNKGKVVLATVKGDVHDIGKNLVGLLLRNYGFEVYDLGKDVPCEDIIQKACEVNAEIIALSALMTTTMVEMQTVVEKAREGGLKVRIMVGGAVVNESYAQEIGAHAYAQDAYLAVKHAKRLVDDFHETMENA